MQARPARIGGGHGAVVTEQAREHFADARLARPLVLVQLAEHDLAHRGGGVEGVVLGDLRDAQGAVLTFAPVLDQYLKAHLFGDIFEKIREEKKLSDELEDALKKAITEFKETF